MPFTKDAKVELINQSNEPHGQYFILTTNCTTHLWMIFLMPMQNLEELILLMGRVHTSKLTLQKLTLLIRVGMLGIRTM